MEEDAEFRYAVAGLLGLGEVLAELKRLREDFNNYVKTSVERWRTWYETWGKFPKDYERRWEEANRRFTRIEGTLGASVEAQFSRYVWEDLKE